MNILPQYIANFQSYLSIQSFLKYATIQFYTPISQLSYLVGNPENNMLFLFLLLLLFIFLLLTDVDIIQVAFATLLNVFDQISIN